MRMKTWLAAALVAVSVAPIMADKHSDAKAQVEFGVAVARRGLWKEALFRWKQAVQIDPEYLAAWNDLAIAYEQMGKFDEARNAYEKALNIEPSNNFIQQNYASFREIYDRQKVRIHK
jgi:Flp pilus assembly protein TadD